MTVARKHGSTQTLLQRILRVFSFSRDMTVMFLKKKITIGQQMATKNSIQPKKSGENPQVMRSTPQKISIQPFPTPPDAPCWSFLTFDIGSGVAPQGLAFHVAADRCRTTKQTAVVKGTCSIFKAINWIDQRKTSNSLKQCVVQNRKRTAWFKGNVSQKCRESFSRENMRLKLWRTVIQIGEWWTHVTPSLRILIFMAHGFQSSPTAFIRPCQLPAIKQICSFKKPSSAWIEVIRENSPFPIPEKQSTVKTPYTVRLSEVFLKSFAQISQLFYGTQDPTSYHQLTIILQCSNFFVSNVSLDPWVWSPKFTHEKWSQLFNLSHTLYIHHKYTYQYN